MTPQALKAFEPTYTYTNGPSTDPNTVERRQHRDGRGAGGVVHVGALPLCAYIAAAGVTYGSGTTCTGTVALKASSPSWPTPA